MSLRGEFIIKNDTEKNPSKPVLQPLPEERNLPQLKRPLTHPFTSFVELPKGISFHNQKDQEEVVLLVRRDFITNASWISTTLLLLILPLFFPFIQRELLPFLNLSSGFSLALAIFYYIVVSGYAFTQYTHWYFQTGIITNLRITDIQINNLLSREVSEIFLDSVKDVSYTQKGLLETLFDFGTVAIKTDSAPDLLIYELVPRPKDISNIITRLIQTEKL